MRFTPASIRELRLPEGVADKIFFDDEVPGFGVRLRAGGSKTFVAQYNVGKQTKKMPLGKIGAIDLGQARALAKDTLAKARLGGDPVGAKLEQRQKLEDVVTFGSVKLQEFLAHQQRKQKPRSHVETLRHLTKHAKPLHALDVAKIELRHVAALLDAITEGPGPVASNRTRNSLSAYFRWLCSKGIIDKNPVAFTGEAIENGPRERTPSIDELARIWHALPAPDGRSRDYGAIVKLLMLTGARRDEIADLRWSEIDAENALITLPPHRTKQKQEHRIYLTQAMLDILTVLPHRATNHDGTARDFVFGTGKNPQHGFQGFGGTQNPKQEVNARLQAKGTPVEDWDYHDFRRSMTTIMCERLGIEPHIADLSIGHLVGSKVSRVYNRAQYAEPRRRAMQTWSDHLMGAVAPERKVIKLEDHRHRAA